MSQNNNATKVNNDGSYMGFPVAKAIHSEQIPLVLETLNGLRPALQKDGGDLELEQIENNIVRIRLKGACCGCSLAAQTLGTIRRELVRVLGNPGVRVLPAL